MATPRIEICYCRQCQWMLRAAWFAQELLTTFAEEIGEVALVPGTGGIFRIRCGDTLVWDRKTNEGFPDIKQLKQLVRDQICPDKQLGHVDRTIADRTKVDSTEVDSTEVDSTKIE